MKTFLKFTWGLMLLIIGIVGIFQSIDNKNWYMLPFNIILCWWGVNHIEDSIS